MLIYHYHPDTGEHTHTSTARLDPLDKQPLIPRYATVVAPMPTVPSGFAAVFTGSSWTLKIDRRGEVWWKPDTAKGFAATPIDFLGDPGLKGLTNIAPVDHRGEVWWTAAGEPVTIDFYGDPVAKGLLAEAPPLPPLHLTLASAKETMVAWINDLTRAITGPVPEDEKLDWPTKEAAARAFIAGTATAEQTAKITFEASKPGETPADLAAKIVAKADLYRAVVSEISRLRRATDNALEAATMPEEYTQILADAQAQAISAAAALGVSLP